MGGCKEHQLMVGKRNAMTMHRSDVKNFQKHEYHSRVSIKVGKNTEVEIIDMGKYWIKISSINQSAYSLRAAFSKDGLKLIGIDTLFYDRPIGEYNKYDKSGKLVNKINDDAAYTFTISDVIKLIKNKYDVDLTKRKKGQIVLRHFENGDKRTPVYNVLLPTKVDEVTYRRILIDGNDGHIITDEEGEYID